MFKKRCVGTISIAPTLHSVSGCIWCETNCSPAHEGAEGFKRSSVGKKVLCRDWSYRVVHQVGSHIILQTEAPGHQRLSVPNHNPLRVGTLNGIARVVAAHKGVDRQTLLDSLR